MTTNFKLKADEEFIKAIGSLLGEHYRRNLSESIKRGIALKKMRSLNK
ncbi:MAG: hypothetical protein RLZZ308_213 [Candidatus Parcubacteria bacterium]|jgi:hypothetical protein